MKKILFTLFAFSLTGCGIGSGVYNTATSPVSSIRYGAGNIIGGAFLAARPEQGTYTYPMTE